MSTPQDPSEEPPAARTGVSRRGLIRALPAAAALGVGAAVLSESAPAMAVIGSPLLCGEGNDGGNAVTSLTSTNAEATFQVIALDPATRTDILPAVIALSDATGLSAALTLDVSADEEHTTGYAYLNGPEAMVQVKGVTNLAEYTSTGSLAMQVMATGAPAIQAMVDSSFAGAIEMPTTAVEVSANSHSVGLRTTSVSGSALLASNADATTTTAVAIVTTAGLAHAVTVESTNHHNDESALAAFHHGVASALRGVQVNPLAKAPAVLGEAGPLGRGAAFSGGAAAVRMLAGPAATHPPSGLLGDFYVDSTARLWFCKGGASWHQLA